MGSDKREAGSNDEGQGPTATTTRPSIQSSEWEAIANGLLAGVPNADGQPGD